jgi:uncharacterized membrane protein YbjE (DUF340 family)
MILFKVMIGLTLILLLLIIGVKLSDNFDRFKKDGLILKKLILMSLVKSLSRKLKMNLRKIIANR